MTDVPELVTWCGEDGRVGQVSIAKFCHSLSVSLTLYRERERPALPGLDHDLRGLGRHRHAVRERADGLLERHPEGKGPPVPVRPHGAVQHVGVRDEELALPVARVDELHVDAGQRAPEAAVPRVERGEDGDVPIDRGGAMYRKVRGVS